MSAVWYCSYFLPPVSTTPSVPVAPAPNLPPVSLIPVVHLHLRISPQIFEIFWNDPNVIFGGLGEDDSWKKTWSKKSRDTVPLRSDVSSIDPACLDHVVLLEDEVPDVPGLNLWEGLRTAVGLGAAVGSGSLLAPVISPVPYGIQKVPDFLKYRNAANFHKRTV